MPTLLPRIVVGLFVGSQLSCATPDSRTLAELRNVEADMTEVQVTNGLDEAMRGYRRYLEEAPESSLTPEAMRRLADLKLEKEFGILGGEDSVLPVPSQSEIHASDVTERVAETDANVESESQFEARATQHALTFQDDTSLSLPDGAHSSQSGPRSAIALYDEILAKYPNYEHSDRVLYQKARAYDELGMPDEAIEVIEQLIAEDPGSRHISEVQFRRAEYFFTRRKYLAAEEAYAAITQRGPVSDFYELALYKLGWALYKQEMHKEALNQFTALLDFKVSNGYDFDQSEDEEAGRRIADTFRIVSLSFSSLGGPDAVQRYFALTGVRPYEDRVYQHLGEFYFEKRRYQDAANSYESFVSLHPTHRAAPHFGIRVVEIYEAGGFPLLVLSAKKDFAANYGVGAPYWAQRPITESPEIVAYLKGNLRDLANHYHATYQSPDQPEQKESSFTEAAHWYREFLASFADDAEAPNLNYQLADLLLEHQDFTDAAVEYERTAYEYPEHDRASAAGYAAIFTHREHQKHAEGEAHAVVRKSAVASTLRFIERFPRHEHASVVLGAAIDDLYEMQQYGVAIETGRRLLAEYPDSEPGVRRSAWLAIAHSAFGIEDFAQAEDGYTNVLAMTSDQEESRQSVVDNLAASIYKQGEQASAANDDRAAAEHFLRIAKRAPDSAIRPVAEYDAGAALIRLEDWDRAVAVLDAFRTTHPDHELHGEATQQLARVYRKQGDLERAATEYERIATDSDDPEIQREALLVAGELYEDAKLPERALEAYERYVTNYPEPLEVALETRFTMASLYRKTGDTARQRSTLSAIIELDESAGNQRTDRIRVLAALASLTLKEELYETFAAIHLDQPFEQSLQRKQEKMDAAIAGFSALLEYEVGEVTAAATFYMAEVYRDFGASLVNSERPTDLSTKELAEYEIVLEEEAYPFEEKAIEVHQKNLELMRAKVYNAWIEKSLAKLASLMPGRYAKFEEGGVPLRSVDHYAYTPPARNVAAVPAATGSEAIPRVDNDPAPPFAPGPAAPAPDADVAPPPEARAPAGRSTS